MGMKLLKVIWVFFGAIRSAGMAANLSRNGKYKEAQAMYRD
jgi:hypothetical protein